MKKKNRHNLKCTCCGGLCEPQPQFFNQDKGYGLCNSCAIWIANRESVEYVMNTYGRDAITIQYYSKQEYS